MLLSDSDFDVRSCRTARTAKSNKSAIKLAKSKRFPRVKPKTVTATSKQI